jgi:hypothetical protein
MTPEQKKFIDEATYKELFMSKRFANVDVDPLFCNPETFAYFTKRFVELQDGHIFLWKMLQ